MAGHHVAWLMVLGDLLASTLAATVAAQVKVTQSMKMDMSQAASNFVRNLRYKQEFRICNAYPYSSALNIRIGQKQLTKVPMAYKMCDTFKPKLKVGDRIDFMIDDTEVGTFTISELPQGDAVLLMVIYRHDTETTSVSFESHVFSSQELAQVAVLDTYRGKERAELRIKEPPVDKPKQNRTAGGAADEVLLQEHVAKNSRSDDLGELLRFSNVVAVDQGAYEISLRHPEDEQAIMTENFVALKRESYVIVRCGVESKVGKPYPQDLMFYPHSNEADLPTPAPPPAARSGSPSKRMWSWLAACGAALLYAIA